MRRYIYVYPYLIIAIILPLFLLSCAVSKKVSEDRLLSALEDTAFTNAHTGFSLYDPIDKKFLINRQGDKYFVPASNTKIISCFAGMKFLGTQLKGMEWIDLDTAILLIPTGDPTFLHPDYPAQPVADFIRGAKKPLYITDIQWQSRPLGSGWSWDDYSEAYMAERSVLPIYGNVIRWNQTASRKENPSNPGDTLDVFVYSEPDVDWPVNFAPMAAGASFDVQRARDKNEFTVTQGREREARVSVPFVADGIHSAIQLIQDSLHQNIRYLDSTHVKLLMRSHQRQAIYSQALDSMLKPMMHRSDNFFAEQTMLMSGHALQGVFNDRAATDEMLRTIMAGMPHPPRWADGSGLSRYNLFTPMDFVWVLDQMLSAYGIQRLQGIFPSSGYGTLSSFLTDQPGKVYAKTGTLTGVIALSGFVQARSGKWLIFSLQVNNHRQPTRLIRAQMEKLLREVIAAY